MYKNRISRTTTISTTGRHPQIFIRRSEIHFDERVTFVEIILATLAALARAAISALKISQGRAKNSITLRTQSTLRIIFSVFSLVKNSLGRANFTISAVSAISALKIFSGTREKLFNAENAKYAENDFLSVLCGEKFSGTRLFYNLCGLGDLCVENFFWDARDARFVS